MALKQDIGQLCLNCKSCSGFKIHGWRKICTECHCSVEQHDILDDSALPILDELKLSDKPFYNNYEEALNMAGKFNKTWLPSGIKYIEIEEFINQYSENLDKPSGEKLRKKKIRLQIPVQDRCVEKFCHLDTAAERQEAEKFLSHRNNREISLGYIIRLQNENIICNDCNEPINIGSFCVTSDIYSTTNNGSNSTKSSYWHPSCFKCTICHEILVDYIHVLYQQKIYCVRHHSQCLRPRCTACDELIFSPEFVRDSEFDYHVKHFACSLCDCSLAKTRYLQIDDNNKKVNNCGGGDGEGVMKNICLTCYDNKLAHTCKKCEQIINSESKNICFKSFYWHTNCFLCNKCNKKLEGELFGLMKDVDNKNNNVDKLLCSDCHMDMVVPKCEACGRPGEYDRKIVVLGDKSWHYDCFICNKCKQAIGNEHFVEYSGKNYCSGCYDKEFAKKCHACSKIIKESGITYKGNHFHYDCFVCHNCKAKISDVKFLVKENKFYCKSCMEDLFANKCCKCSRVITGENSTKYVKFQEKCWHTNCFNCTKCNNSLVDKSFSTKDRDFLCTQCISSSSS